MKQTMLSQGHWIRHTTDRGTANTSNMASNLFENNFHFDRNLRRQPPKLLRIKIGKRLEPVNWMLVANLKIPNSFFQKFWNCVADGIPGESFHQNFWFKIIFSSRLIYDGVIRWWYLGKWRPQLWNDFF